MIKTTAIALWVLVTVCAFAKVNPEDFPLSAKITDVKETETGSTSKTTRGSLCDNLPADSPYCKFQRPRTVTKTMHKYVAIVEIGDKVYEAESPVLLEIGDYKANVKGTFIRLLMSKSEGDFKEHTLRIVGIHQSSRAASAPK